jgi:serine/threonine protein kinase
MQYLEGTQLNQLERIPSPEELRKWSCQLISALYTCHVIAKVCHRDIKPENLKVTGSNNDLVLFDFGASECFIEENDIVT